LSPGLAIGSESARSSASADLAAWRIPERRATWPASTCEGQGPIRAAVWQLGGAGIWAQVAPERSFDGMPMLAGVATEGDVYFSAGGDELSQPDGVARSAAWWSKGGSDWARIGSPALGAGRIVDMTEAFGGLLAVGVATECSGPGGVRIWQGSLQ